MARPIYKLTARQIETIAHPGRYGDRRGLWLHVSPTLTKSWVFRYMLERRARVMGFGSIELVALAEARRRAHAARKLLLDGIDPIDAREQERASLRLQAARSLTFKAAAEQHIAAHEKAWRNPKHRAQWRATLATYAYPVFGDLPVATVDTTLVMKVLETLWTTKPETASRVRGRIESVLDWAGARGHRSGENPARWRGHLDKLLPAKTKVRKVRHHAALPYPELPTFMAALRQREGVTARALELTILTALRTSEVIGARWDEIDFREKVWKVPAERMKAKREHRVPLSDRALLLLAELHAPDVDLSSYIFRGTRSKSCLSDMSMLKLVKEMHPGLTVHGFRSTFKDWCAETTAYPDIVSEMALAHTIPDKVQAAYRRGDLYAKRQRLMTDWATYCTRKPISRGKVIPLRASDHDRAHATLPGPQAHPIPTSGWSR